MTTTTVSPKPASQVEGRKAKAAAYYASFVALGLTVASLGPTLPGLAEHTGTVLSQISYLFTARSLGYLLGSFQGGKLFDRLPGHPIMAVMLLVIAATLALVPTISILWVLIGVLLILGVAEGTLDVGGNTLLIWVFRTRVGPYMNGLHFFFGVGAFLAPIIIAQAVLLSGDITWAYWTLALLILPVSVWLLRLPSPKRLSAATDSPAGRIDRLLVSLVALFLFLYTGAEVAFGGWIFTYAVALDLADATAAAYLTSAFWGALTTGRLIGIPLAARFRPRFILLADLLGCLASLGVILLWQDSLIMVWLGSIGVGLAMASIFPMTLTLAGNRMNVTGRVTGLFFIGASLGSMFLPWLIGQRFESVGPQVTMLIIFADLIIALGVYTVLIRYSARFKEIN